MLEAPAYDLELKYKDVYGVRQGGVIRLSLPIKGAERSDSGVYDLLLENKVGKNKAQIKVKVIGRPSAPVGPLVFSEIHANSVKVSWKVPTDDGGSEILGYIVERREATRNAWYTVDSRVTDTHLVVKGLKE